MKKKLSLFCLLALLFLLAPKISAQCTSGTQYPGGIYQATNEAGAGVINTDAQTGQYTNVHILPSKRYNFSTSVSTDYITITNSSGTQVYASGVTPLAYVSVYNETIRYYIHQNAQCQTTNQFYRSRNISWVVAPPCLDPVPTGVSNINPISCTLSFTEPNVAPYFGYEAYVSTSSATPAANVYSASSTTNPIFVTGLNPDTNYHYWLRSDCLYQKGDWIYGGTFSTISSLLCNSAYYGLYPKATFTPTCTGNNEIFSDDSKNGSYSNIAITPNTQYTFSTDYPLDFVTITNALGTVVLASGINQATWNSGGNSGVVRFYSHDNAQCGYGITGTRAKYVKCVTTSATCLPPTNLAVSNITSNSCRLAWTAPAAVPGSGYEIYMVTNNTAPGVTTAATFTSATPSIDVVSGLTAGVTYYYWIRSNCGSEKSTWASGGSFTANASLLCNSATNGLYPNETFMPTCTGSPEQIVSNAWAGEYSNVSVSSNKQYTFTSSVATDYITITNTLGTAVLASGTTPLSWSSGSNTGVIRYYLHTNSNCGSQEANRVKSIQCAASTGGCGLPTALSVSNITSNSCRLNWSAPASGATSYDIYIITSNTAPTSSTSASATSNNAGVGVLNGIDPSTTYYYWIRSNCSGTKSNWVAGGSFTTIASLTCNGATHGLYPEATFIPTCTGSAEQIAPDAWAGEYSNVNISSNKQYTFTSSITTDYITITNANGTAVLASGVTPLVWNSNSTSGVIRYHINTNANCGTQNTLTRIRSIKCVNAPSSSCNAPTQFWSNGITSTTATLNWIPSTSAPNGGYLYVYNTTQTVGGFDGSTFSTSADLTDLLPNTTYYWWVAADCVTSQSQWALGGSFTTLSGTSACNAPTQLWSENITATTATLNWIESTSSPNGGYLYAYNTNPVVGGFDGSTLFTSADLTDLLPGTTYYWWVAADCVTSQSQWALGGSFTTLPGTTTGCWQSISAGLAHTVAIRPDGTLWAWGGNDFGQLGDGTAIAKTTPVQIGTANDWQSVSAGTFHTMAIKTNGTLWAWGINGNGRLGDGTTTDRIFPIQIGSATNWKSVCAGDNNTFAIKTDGTLWAWGYNGYAQFGDGTMNSKTTPYQIGTATNWQSVDVGNLHTLAIKTNGTLWAWGTNTYGQVGDGTTAVRFSPVQIGTATDWKSIAAGANHSVGLKTNGILYTWGHNLWGQLGDYTNVSKSSPVAVFDGVQNIGAGSNHTVGTTTFGNRWYCGINTFGQLGDGTTTNTNAIQVTNSNNHALIVAGTQYTVLLNTDGSLSACGENVMGQLGNGSTVNSPTLVSVSCPTSLNVDDFTANNDLKAFPNPVSNILNISYVKEISTLSVYNLLGQEVLTKSLQTNEGTLDFSNLPSGNYLVKVTAENLVKTLKVIKL